MNKVKTNVESSGKFDTIYLLSAIILCASSIIATAMGKETAFAVLFVGLCIEVVLWAGFSALLEAINNINKVR